MIPSLMFCIHNLHNSTDLIFAFNIILDFSLFTVCKEGAKNFIGSLDISSNSRNISSMGVQIFQNIWTGGVQIFRDRTINNCFDQQHVRRTPGEDFVRLGVVCPLVYSVRSARGRLYVWCSLSHGLL